MPRLARVVAPGFPHHVTQRGNRRSEVFSCDADRHRYLGLIQRYAERYGLSIWAYCLMPNHVHFVAVPRDEAALAKTLRDAHQIYAIHFNQRCGLTGHLWQGRFYSCILGEQHLWTAVRYVETNPVRAGLAVRAEDYAWSSAASHCGRRADALLSGDFPADGVVADWSAWLNGGNSEQEKTLQHHTRTGRPLGTEVFVQALEKQLKRALLPKKPGRKPKAKRDC